MNEPGLLDNLLSWGTGNIHFPIFEERAIEMKRQGSQSLGISGIFRDPGGIGVQGFGQIFRKRFN